MRGERGFALVITLIVTALLVALLVEFVSEVYVDTSHSHNFVASQQAGILAESGIAGGIQLLKASALLRQGSQPYSSLLEPWAQPLSYDAGVGSVTISIEEESGKFDLNAATTPNGTPNESTKMAKRLLTRIELSPELTDALMDWRDDNDTPLTNGAETSYYSTLKPAYQAHNSKLETFEELALVKGFTPQVLAKLRACATVGDGTGTQINVNTAPKELLAALDEKLMSSKLVDDIIEYRKTRVIKSLADVPGLESYIQLGTVVNFQGTIYRIHAEAKVGESVSVAEAVVTNIGNEKPTILYWREY